MSIDINNLLLQVKPNTEIAFPTTIEELEKLRIFHRKMIRPQHLALHAMVPLISHMSPSRSVMAIQQESQHVIFKGMQKPIVMTGVEYEFAKHAFRDEMPETGKILAIIPRYPRTLAMDSIKVNPETIVMYLTDDSTLDYFSITPYGKYHPNFGYLKRMKQSNLSLVKEGMVIQKGTVFAESTGVSEDGFYMTGKHARLAYVDDERTSDDGICLKKSFVDSIVSDYFEEIETGVGSTKFPLNMFGDDENYKIFPDIGEPIKHEGTVMVLREYDMLNSPVLMSRESLRQPNGIGDIFLSAEPTPIPLGKTEEDIDSAIVSDIIVIRNPKAKRLLPPTMAGQLEKYAAAYQEFLQNILRVEQKLTHNLKKRDPNAVLKMSTKMSILLTQCYGLTDYAASRFNAPTEFQSHRAKADEWTIYITVHHKRKSTLGDKFTGSFGDKGVTVRAIPDEDLPEDVDGLVASNSTIGRTNMNRLFVPRINQAAVDLTEWMCQQIHVNTYKYGQYTGITENYLMSIPKDVIDRIWERLMMFYAIISPHLYVTYNHLNNNEATKFKHLLSVLNEVVHPLMPCDNPINDTDAIIHLTKEGFLKPYQPLTYKDASGNFVVTEKPIPVLWTLLRYLEKIANEGSAVSAGRLQHHGLPASRTTSEKYRDNYRNVATRNLGEHETEILLHDSLDPTVVAELIDLSSNPESMRAACVNALTADKPTALDGLVDRKEIPYGRTRPLNILRHFNFTQGVKLEFMDESEAEHLPNLESEPYKGNEER